MVCIGKIRLILQWQKQLVYRWQWRPYLKWENHYPGVQLLFVKVYLPILKLEEYGVVFKEQSIPYFGYKPDSTI
jgi:hypothetical protein